MNLLTWPSIVEFMTFYKTINSDGLAKNPIIAAG